MLKRWWLWCLIALILFGIGGAIWTYAFILWACAILVTVGGVVYTIALLVQGKVGEAIKWALITAFLIWFLVKFFF